MLIIACEKPGELINRDSAPPVVSDGHALLKVTRIGICGTDLHAFKGNQAYFNYPRILGHEIAAQVVEVGANINGIKANDQVVVMPYINCEKCDACRAGKSNCCEKLSVFGVHRDGGMQEFISFPTRLLIKANDLTYDEIAIVEPLSIGAHALRRANATQNSLVVVIGCGPIGMGIIQLAKYLGSTVIAVDVNERRLRQAVDAFGADFGVNAMSSPIDEVTRLTNGKLADIVIDATGSKQAIEGSLAYMRHGGCVVLVGIFKGELNFMHPAIHAKETTLLCSRNATDIDFQFVMKVLREKKFNTDAYITSKVKAKDIIGGFPEWSAQDSREIKVVTEWGEAK